MLHRKIPLTDIGDVQRCCRRSGLSGHSTRTQSHVMHEWSHTELNHKTNRVERSEAGLLLPSDYPKERRRGGLACRIYATPA